MTDDDQPTPEELRQAEALARALEGQPAAAAADSEDLAVAGLLRFARSEGILDPARATALGAGLRGEAGRQRRRRRAARWLLVLMPLTLSAAAAAFLLVPRRPPAVVLPSPSPALLATQAAAARGNDGAFDALDRQMREYRRLMFKQLRAPAGGQP
jgi:hypothetical protein